MPKATVERYVPLRTTPDLDVDLAPVPDHVEDALPGRQPFLVRQDMADLHAGLGTRQQIEDELDDIAACMRGFYMKSPDQVMTEISAYSARLSELYVLLHRVEARDRQYTRIRTQQVTQYREELEVQFRIASRQLEVQRMDLTMMGAQT